MAFLKMVSGNGAGQIFELTGDRIVLGRHPSCNIVLNDISVSRHHAQLLQSHGRFYLEDLRSRNKTFLNDVEIQQRTELAEADCIAICDILLTFHVQIPSAELDAISAPLESASSQKVVVDIDDFIGVSQKTGEKNDCETGNQEVDDDAVEPSIPLRLLQDDESAEKTAAEKTSEGRGSASIISMLDAQPDQPLRLSVRPETKLRAILDINNVLGETFEFHEVLEKILEQLFRVFPQADEGFVLLKEPEHGKLLVRATKTRFVNDEESVRVSMTIVKKAMADCQAILSHDASSDVRFDSSESLSRLKIRSMLCVPLVPWQAEPLGVIQLNTKGLKQQFEQDDLDLLASVASPITLAVENANLHHSLLHQRDLERALERERDDVELAVQVQLDFLPTQPPDIAGYQFFDFYEAAMRVGGDYFDYVQLPDGRIAVTLGDVAGKGVPAALLMAKLSSSVRFHLLTQATVADAVNSLNAEISSSGLGHRFITFVAVVLDPVNHQMTIVNAGHMPPVLRERNGSVRELADEVAAVPLGVVRDQLYKSATVSLQPGESVLLFTDGITETLNKSEKIYGRKRLQQFMGNFSGDFSEFIPALLTEIDEFSGGCPQRDDICLVCVHRF